MLPRRQFNEGGLCARLDGAVRIMVNDLQEELLCVFGLETFGLILDGFVLLAPRRRVRGNDVRDLLVQDAGMTAW